MPHKLKSRKLWMATASALFIVITKGAGLDVDPQVYWAVVGVATAYILGESYIDASRKS